MQKHDQTHTLIKHCNTFLCVDKGFFAFKRLHFSFYKMVTLKVCKSTLPHALRSICCKIRQSPTISEKRCRRTYAIYGMIIPHRKFNVNITNTYEIYAGS